MWHPANALIRIKARPWTVVVWAAMAVWSAVVFALLRADYLNFLYLRFDLGNMTQAVWSTAQGRPLEMTGPLGEQVSRFAFHVDPILALLTPLWVVAPTPLTLATVQVVLCALGALPVFWLARRHLGSERMAAFVAVAYLLYPWTAWNVLDAMHPVTLAMPLFLLAVWFLDSNRIVAFAACALLVMACGELMGLIVAALGVWYFVTRRRRAGAVIAICGTAWSVIALKIIVPVFADGPSVYHSYFESVGGSPEGVVRTSLTDPAHVASELVSTSDLAYLALLAAPLLALPVLAPGLVAVALPQLLANGLSDRSSLIDPRAHYSSIIIAVLFTALIFGLARLPAQYRSGACALVVFVSAAGALIMGPPHARGSYSSLFTSREFAERVDALRSATALVPPGAPVSATNTVGSHLSARRYFYSVPVIGRAEWIVVDRKDAGLPGIPVGYWGPKTLGRFVSSTKSSQDWRSVFDRGGVLVFRRARSEPR